MSSGGHSTDNGLDGYLGVSSNGVRAQHDSPIVSTRAQYMRYGVAALLIDASVSTSSAVEYMRRFGKPIVIVGLSNGARRLAGGLGSHPAGFVIWSGVLSAVKAAIDPSALPPTLVIANHEDKCQATPPEAVEPFKIWAGGKVRVLWVGGGVPGSTADQCNSFGASPHFMPGHEAEVVSAIAGFAKSVR
jgi:hypothetical protein